MLQPVSSEGASGLKHGLLDLRGEHATKARDPDHRQGLRGVRAGSRIRAARPTVNPPVRPTIRPSMTTLSCSAVALRNGGQLNDVHAIGYQWLLQIEFDVSTRLARV